MKTSDNSEMKIGYFDRKSAENCGIGIAVLMMISIIYTCFATPRELRGGALTRYNEMIMKSDEYQMEVNSSISRIDENLRSMQSSIEILYEQHVWPEEVGNEEDPEGETIVDVGPETEGF